jgi:hypothetical protein
MPVVHALELAPASGRNSPLPPQLAVAISSRSDSAEALSQPSHAAAAARSKAGTTTSSIAAFP